MSENAAPVLRKRKAQVRFERFALAYPVAATVCALGMKTRPDERYESDLTPSRDVALRYRAVIDDETQHASLALIHYRGGEEEFRLGQEYCASNDPGDRATGADILAQLGWGEQTFREESIGILIPLLADPDPCVVHSAVVALGHRSATSAIPALLRQVAHSNPLVRYGVVLGLSGQEDSRAIDGLIQLAADDDHDVRNWAVFGLGSQIDSDSPKIRDALHRALGDPDQEIRGEALFGLAKRNDPAVVPALLNEWRHDDISLLSIEAAQETGDPCLYQYLKELSETLPLDDDPYFAGRLAQAVAACQPESNKQVLPPLSRE